MKTKTTTTQRYGRSPRHTAGLKSFVLSNCIIISLICGSTLAFSSISVGTRLPRTNPTGARVGVKALGYRDDEGMATKGASRTDGLTETTTAKVTRKTSAWWKSLVRGDVSEKDSDKVDEYLEFLDKRYHRLHDNDSEEPTEEKMQLKAPKFSALKWLQGTSESPAPESSESDDALYVLGVAGLASQKLLQKHATQEAKQKKAQQLKASVKATVSPNSAIDAVVMGPSPAPVRRNVLLLRWMMVQYNLFHRKQSLRLRAVLTFLARQVPSNASRVAKTLWAFGGGKKNVAWTLTVMTALTFLIIKPLLELAAP